MAVWPFKKRDLGDSPNELIPPHGGVTRNPWGGSRVTSRDVGLSNSTMYGCLLLRADLVSQMPIDVFTTISEVTQKTSTPPVLITPSDDYDIDEWMWASQFDLDSVGMFVGSVVSKDRLGRPTRIEPLGIQHWRVQFYGGKAHWIVDGKETPREELWVERAYPLSGSPLGLSPIGHAAYSLGKWKDASDFAATWFGNNAVPGGHLKNVARVLKPRQARAAKESFKASVQGGDVWVSGSDWEYTPLAAKASDSAFLELIGATDLDVCRFFRVPGDLVDVVNKGKSITYANISQRNLQFLIMNLGPAITKRERRFTNRLTTRPQFVKLNTGALLRMDPATQIQSNAVAINSRQLAPSEARADMGRAPFTPDQLAEFDQLFPSKAPIALPSAPSNDPAEPADDGGQDS